MAGDPTSSPPEKYKCKNWEISDDYMPDLYDRVREIADNAAGDAVDHFCNGLEVWLYEEDGQIEFQLASEDWMDRQKRIPVSQAKWFRCNDHDDEDEVERSLRIAAALETLVKEMRDDVANWYARQKK